MLPTTRAALLASSSSAALLVAAAMAACGAEPVKAQPSPWLTANPVATPAPSPTAPPAAEPDLPEVPFDFAGELRSAHEVVARAPSQHELGDLEGRVLANDLAKPYPKLGPSSDLPVGATLLEQLYKPGVPEPVETFAMVKRSATTDAGLGTWEFFVIGSNGVVAARGRMPLCARCHAEAPHDHLFGRAR